MRRWSIGLVLAIVVGCPAEDEGADCPGLGCPADTGTASMSASSTSASSTTASSTTASSTTASSSETDASSGETGGSSSAEDPSDPSAESSSTPASSSESSTTMPCEGANCPELAECFGLGVWQSCTQYCTALDATCVAGGCGGATVVYYDDVDACTAMEPSGESAQDCDAGFMQGGGVSFGRCCCD